MQNQEGVARNDTRIPLRRYSLTQQLPRGHALAPLDHERLVENDVEWTAASRLLISCTERIPTRTAHYYCLLLLLTGSMIRPFSPMLAMETDLRGSVQITRWQPRRERYILPLLSLRPAGPDLYP